MNRRSLLKFLSGILGAASATIVSIPGVSYVLETLRRTEDKTMVRQRVMRLDDLPIGRPVQVPLVGNRRDAWTVHASEVIGRVWLVRAPQSGDSPSPQEVAAFTAVCPHLGCTIQLAATSGQFICPCHRAAFSLNGEKVSDEQLGHRNHAPRGMDSLECRIVQDEETNESWVEVNLEQFERGLTQKIAKA